jgi:hypothetical protein
VKLHAQSVSLWLAAFFGVVLFGAFIAFPGFFPPMSPSDSADQVAAFYQDHQTMIRASMVVVNLCAVMLVPFFMVVVYQMKRMATPTQVLAYGYLSATATGVTLYAIADLFWLIAAFRPDRDPQQIQLLNDLAWISFVAPVGMIAAQNACLAAAIYLDARTEPILPRWVGHLSLAVGLAMLPSAGAAVFRDGPLAWNGVVSFWVRNGAYAVFLVVLFVMLRRAIIREQRETDGDLEPARLEPAPELVR